MARMCCCPRPWLAFTFISAVLTLVLLFVTVRLLKPVQYGLPRAAQRRGAKQA